MRAILEFLHKNTTRAYATMKIPRGRSIKAINYTKFLDTLWSVSVWFLFAVEANASNAAAIDESVIDMCNHDRNVLSEAKNVFGSSL